MGWTAWIGDDPYAVRFLWGLLGNLFLAFGIYWQAASKTIVQPGEGMVLAFSVVLRKSFGTIKIWNDVTLVLLAVILGFVFLGHVAGVREGTVQSPPFWWAFSSRGSRRFAPNSNAGATRRTPKRALRNLKRPYAFRRF